VPKAKHNEQLTKPTAFLFFPFPIPIPFPLLPTAKKYAAKCGDGNAAYACWKLFCQLKSYQVGL